MVGMTSVHCRNNGVRRVLEIGWPLGRDATGHAGPAVIGATCACGNGVEVEAATVRIGVTSTSNVGRLDHAVEARLVAGPAKPQMAILRGTQQPGEHQRSSLHAARPLPGGPRSRACPRSPIRARLLGHGSTEPATVLPATPGVAAKPRGVSTRAEHACPNH